MQPFSSLRAMREFDSPCALAAQYGGVWHCIVGRNFGSFITHEAKHQIFYYRGQTAILLFKTG